MSFHNGFLWGAASASFQIEGGARDDGKGPSIWDTFSHTPGKTVGGHTGDTACDAYHRLDEDLDLLKELGLKNYRFSISWPRVLPDGRGKVNAPGLAYYDRLVDGCLKRDIEPWITLYHWDLPQTLQDEGGWTKRDTIYAFRDYAALIASHFKGRATHFMTFNEPQCFLGLGHSSCVHAPGIPLSEEELFSCWHHVLLAHGLACQAIRREIPDAQIGVASTGSLGYICPEDTARQDLFHQPTPKPLKDASFLTAPLSENPSYYFNHQWFLDPICLGHYPDDPASPWAPFTPSVSAEDLELIAQPTDFIGLNIYNGHEYSWDGEKLTFMEKYEGFPRTALKWPITPEVLYWGPRLIYERYGLPILISENGLSCNDKIYLDGQVHDPDRIDFLTRYLRELEKADEAGIPVIGYFHWSLTDNFEWHNGYDERFGLIYIDYRTKRRILKDSAHWYSQVAALNAIPETGFLPASRQRP